MVGLNRSFVPETRFLLNTLKPNLLSHQNPDEGTVTDPGVTGALVQLVREAGARRIFVGENPALVKARVAFLKTGTQEMVEKAGGECCYLDEEIYIEGITV